MGLTPHTPARTQDSAWDGNEADGVDSLQVSTIRQVTQVTASQPVLGSHRGWAAAVGNGHGGLTGQRDSQDTSPTVPATV